MSKRLLMLAAICFLGNIVGCSELPEFPTVETKLVDHAHGKLHRYNLPKARGERAPFLSSIPLDTRSIDKSYCFAPREYAKIEEYIGAVEDIARQRCR